MSEPLVYIHKTQCAHLLSRFWLLWPMDCNPLRLLCPHGILQARLLEWIVISLSRDLPTQRLNPQLFTSSKFGPVMMSHLLWSSQKSQDSWGNACSPHLLSSGRCCQSTQAHNALSTAGRPHLLHSPEADTYERCVNGLRWHSEKHIHHLCSTVWAMFLQGCSLEGGPTPVK